MITGGGGYIVMAYIVMACIVMAGYRVALMTRGGRDSSRATRQVILRRCSFIRSCYGNSCVFPVRKSGLAGMPLMGDCMSYYSMSYYSMDGNRLICTALCGDTQGPVRDGSTQQAHTPSAHRVCAAHVGSAGVPRSK